MPAELDEKWQFRKTNQLRLTLLIFLILFVTTQGNYRIGKAPFLKVFTAAVLTTQTAENRM
jgi:hypothetical protein